MADAAYDNVTVVCSGDRPRNNVGEWKLHSVIATDARRGFDFYAAKDREMAAAADFGLMIWDGKSSGTALNVLRLVRAGKKAVLLKVPEKKASTFKGESDWNEFISGCSAQFVNDLRERATPDEWSPRPRQAAFIDLETLDKAIEHQPSSIGQDSDLMMAMNDAFASGEMAAVINLLGSFAKARGMATVAKEAGLSRESLYRSLSSDGNPEFSTILKVIQSLGLRLSVVTLDHGAEQKPVLKELTAHNKRLARAHHF